MDENICKASGFKDTVLWCQGRACSRDKALYYFCRNNIPFKHLWFIEEDVFIPTIHTIENINKKYPFADLLCKSNGIVYERRTDWHWPIVNEKIKNMAPPYSSSLVCAIRVSKKMLNVINFYVKKYKTLFLDEALFPTLAVKARLKIRNPPEFSNIHYNHRWRKHDLNSTNLFHPIKNIYKQYAFRRYIHRQLLKPL